MCHTMAMSKSESIQNAAYVTLRPIPLPRNLPTAQDDESEQGSETVGVFVVAPGTLIPGVPGRYAIFCAVSPFVCACAESAETIALICAAERLADRGSCIIAARIVASSALDDVVCA